MSDGALRRQLVRILPTVGYEETSKKKFWRHVSDNWDRWVSLLTYMGLVSNDHLGRSRRSLQVRADAAEVAQVEEYHWASTRAVLALLVAWPASRRFRHVREMCLTVLQKFLEHCASSRRIEEVKLLEWTPPASAQLACREPPIVDGVCACLQGLVLAPPDLAHASSPQKAVADKLMVLQGVCGCAWAKAWLLNTVAELSLIIDTSCISWGSSIGTDRATQYSVAK